MTKHRQLAQIGGIAALLLLAFVALACSGADESDVDSPPVGGNAARSGDGGGGDDADLSAMRTQEGSIAPGEVGPGSNLQSSLNRKIIQSTSVDIHVEKVSREFFEIAQIAETNGGFVVNSPPSTIDDEQVADITIRVPGDRYQNVLNQIRGMGDVQQQSSNANDVTEEFTDLQARLRTLEATEQRYLELLAEANGINEILIVQDRLDSVRGQIEQVQGRINLLDGLTELATITAHLRPIVPVVEAPVDGGGLSPLEAASNAWESSLATLRVFAVIAFAVAAYSWWLAPPLALGGLAAHRLLNRRSHPRTGASI